MTLFEGSDMQKSRYDQPLRKLRQAREDLRHEYSRIRHDLVRLDKMIAQLETMNLGGGRHRPTPPPPMHSRTSRRKISRVSAMRRQPR